MTTPKPTVLILGAGINGCALARELLLNGVHVWLVDRSDIAFGTTAYSSRLIHGGLRYLEYGEFDLVRESLAERTRLLRLAPQFVKPLQLFIPVDNRYGGLLSAAGRFLGWPRFNTQQKSRRGAWLVRLGLWFYDTYARDPTLPKRAVHRADEPDIVAVDRRKFRWLLSYYDAQVLYPERFTLALVEDARQIATERGLQFEMLTYHAARLDGSQVVIQPADELKNEHRPSIAIKPDLIVNATGAWVDLTLKSLGVPSKRLIGGTKGSHFITHHAALRQCLGDKGIYAEAADGRPVFILPLGDAVLVGTTDEHYKGDPAAATATEPEIAYLLATVNEIVPQASLNKDDIDATYSGVRPLPFVESQSTAGITRRHWLAEITGSSVPLFAIVGGKLTTCRSLAEESAARLLARLGLKVTEDSRERLLPGAENYPANREFLHQRWSQLAAQYGFDENQLRAMWRLCGTRIEKFLRQTPDASTENLAGTAFPLDFVRWIIRHERVVTLDDLVERRLMLHFERELSLSCLRQSAELMVSEGKLTAAELESTVNATAERLQNHFGRSLLTPVGD